MKRRRDTDRRTSMRRASSDTAAYLSTCCQIFNTILGGGGGMVPLPYAFRLFGSVRSAMMAITLCGTLAAYTACAVVSASCLVPDGTSLQLLARQTLGHSWGIGVRILLVAFAFGSGVAALTIFADVAHTSIPWCAHSTWVMLASCLVGPLVVFVRQIERFAPISIIASVLVAVFFFYAGWFYFAHPVTPFARVERVDAPTTAARLQAISVINLSFNCHFNQITLFRALPTIGIAPPREAARIQQRYMRILICVAMALALTVYSAIGYWGFCTFEYRPSGNALADYATLSPFGAALNNALAASQLATLPLLVHEGVRETIALGGDCLGKRPPDLRRAPLKDREVEDCNIDVDATREGLLRHPSGGSLLSPRMAQLFGAVWVVLMALAAMAAADTSRVLSVLSALCGGPLVSILPLWMFLRAGHGMTPVVAAFNSVLLAGGTAATVACSLSALGVVV